jgi:uncharacterized protein with ParB-like and HNH nuclease domain
LIFFKEKDSKDFLLLDGRQRLTTMLEIFENPLKFINQDKMKLIFEDTKKTTLMGIAREPKPFLQIYKIIKKISLNDNLVKQETIG